MAVEWISKGDPNCDGSPIITEKPEGTLNVACPKCSSEFNTPKL